MLKYSCVLANNFNHGSYYDIVCKSLCLLPEISVDNSSVLHIEKTACGGFPKNCKKNVDSSISTNYLFKEDIGDSVYFVVNYYRGRLLYHIREYKIGRDGEHFPTKHGIVFDLEKWAEFQSNYLHLINDGIEKYKSSNAQNTVMLNLELGWRQFAENIVYNRVKKSPEIIILKRKFLPISYGVKLTFEQLDNLLTLVKTLPTFE